MRVSELGFGGWAIGGNGFGNSYGDTDDAVSRAAIWKALALGITLFDTADVYGHGHSEALLGEVFAEWPGPPPVVVTKAGINFYRRDEDAGTGLDTTSIGPRGSAKFDASAARDSRCVSADEPAR